MDDLLLPGHPDDAHALFELFHGELEEAVGTRPETPRLALLAVRHLFGENMLRMLLIGPPGVGKTFMVRKLASVLELPFLEISVSNMVEEGWKGAGPSEHLATLFRQAIANSPTHAAAEKAANRAIVLIDEMDKARLAPPSASASTRDNRIGKQVSLLPLIGDGTLTIERSGGSHLEWSSRRALVICAGVFDGLEPDQPSSEDLADWGMLPELAERLAFGTILRVRPLSQKQVAKLLRSAIEPTVQVFSLFGYDLHVAEEVLRYLAGRLADESRGLGPRSAVGILRTAAEEVLLRLILRQDPPRSFILTPDDLEIPDSSRGLWRE